LRRDHTGRELRRSVRIETSERALDARRRRLAALEQPHELPAEAERRRCYDDRRRDRGNRGREPGTKATRATR
jgi:hypothetical protein